MPFDHATKVFKFNEKGFAVSRQDLLQGLDDASSAVLIDMGNDGWELVAALPYSSGAVGFFSNTQSKTDAVLAFFKRGRAT